MRAALNARRSYSAGWNQIRRGRAADVSVLIAGKACRPNSPIATVAYGTKMLIDGQAFVGSSLIVNTVSGPESRSIRTKGEQKQESSLHGSAGAEGAGSS